MSAVMLKTENLTKAFGKKEVLKGVDLSLHSGEGIGIVGVNGSGKSTLLQILAGTLKPDGGQLMINGQNPLKNEKVFANYVGFVPQQNPLIEELTVLDNLRLWYGGSQFSLKDDMKFEFIKQLDVQSMLKEKVSNLSGGMKKRASIACAIAHHPPILILDEPGSSLDLISKKDIQQYLSLFVKRGGAFILASHELMELVACDRYYMLLDGKLEEWPADRPLEEIVTKLRH